MNAISTFRPFRECSVTALRTFKASQTWTPVFDRIRYLGSHEPSLERDGVEFVPSQQFPKIIEVVQLCAETPGWTALVNADIWLDLKMADVPFDLEKVGGSCAVSRRYEFTGENLKKASVVDNGLDFFMATQDVWKKIAREYPDHYRFGHSSWDALMLGGFNVVARSTLYDLTKRRLVFHPRHGERRQVFKITDNVRTRFRDMVAWPKLHL